MSELKQAIDALSLTMPGGSKAVPVVLGEGDPVEIITSVRDQLSGFETIVAMHPEVLATIGSAPAAGYALSASLNSLSHALAVATKLLQADKAVEAKT